MTVRTAGPDAARRAGDRFTAEGSARDEARLRQRLDALVPLVRAAVPGAVSIFVVGGYGRGEGGLLDGAPVNDVDLLVVADRLTPLGRGRAASGLRAAAPALAAVAGVTVDVGLQDRRGLARAPVAILWYEMAAGHRLLWGAGDVAFPEIDPGALPLDEAVLLLTNRGSSRLLRRVERAEGSRTGPGSLEETIDASKLAMAWGDALLLRARRYVSSYAERARRLENSPVAGAPGEDEIRRLYARAIRFKVRPSQELVDEWGTPELTARVDALHGPFLAWFEEQRLGVPIRSWRRYADPRIRKLERRSPRSRMAAKHVLRLGLPRDRANAALHAAGTYERLISVLPLLLLSRDPADWMCAERLLNGRPAGAGEEWLRPSRRYLRLWKGA